MLRYHCYKFICIFSLFFLITHFSHTSYGQVSTDVETVGGLVIGSNVIAVTSLADKGPGSFRNALTQCGPCVIIFDVSGIIEINSDLEVTADNVTIAGETAPSPGIIIHGGTLKIRSSDVDVSHISIYPGSSNNPKIAENLDGISIYGSVSKNKTLSNIILRNVSVGWGVDENIALQGLVDGVKIEHSLFAQPLRNGGHPKGVHSMNMLLGNHVGRAIIVGSILAGAEQRNPRLTNGNKVSFINNLVVANGAAAAHIDTSKEIINSGYIDIIGNVFVSSPYSNCKRAALSIDKSFFDKDLQTSVFLKDNIVDNSFKPSCYTMPDEALLGSIKVNHSENVGWKILPTHEIQSYALKHSGSHPNSRNPIDQRVVNEIESGKLGILSNENDVGGLPAIAKKYNNSIVPKSFKRIKNNEDIKLLQSLLCQRRKELTQLSDCY